MRERSSIPKCKSTENLIAVVDRWMEEVWQKGNMAAIDDLHAPDFVDRSPAGRAPDTKGFKEGIADLFRAFPDFRARTEDLVVDVSSGKVALRWTGAGIHTGEFLGAPPTERRITFCGIEILRIQDGRIAERWGEWDGISLMEQLGLISHTDENA